MERYLLALDQGTTSSRCILFNRHGEAVSKVQREFSQIFPQEGWVEHDASEIYASQYAVMTEAVISAGIHPEEIGAIADFARSLEGVSEMHILPYHKMGTDKYTGLGREYLLPDIEPPSKEHMQKLLEVVRSKGLYGQIGG